MRFFLLLTLIIAGLFIPVFTIKAENPILIPLPDTIVLDKVEFKKEGVYSNHDRLVRSFIDSAFSANIHAPNDFPEKNQTLSLSPYIPGTRRESIFRPDRFKKEYPWLAEYLLREKGMPRFFVINKWAKDIRISTGYPFDMKPFEKVEVYGPQVPPHFYKDNPSKNYKNPNGFVLQPVFNYAEPSDETAEILDEEFSKLLPEVSDLTGLKITYLPHDKENKGNVADIRIVFVKAKGLPHIGSEWVTEFKRGPINWSSTNSGWPKLLSFEKDIEPHLSTAVDFTPYSMKQVFGYFLTNAENKIELAICYIMEGQKKEMLQALIRECIVRSLGLPDAHDLSPAHLLSLWNDPEKWKPSTRYFRMKDKPVSAYFSVPPALTETDRFFIRLLYQPEIRPGMGPNELLRTLEGF